MSAEARSTHLCRIVGMVLLRIIGAVAVCCCCGGDVPLVRDVMVMIYRDSHLAVFCLLGGHLEACISLHYDHIDAVYTMHTKPAVPSVRRWLGNVVSAGR